MPPKTHYFTSEPFDPATARQIEVVLAGRALAATTASGVFSPSRIDLGTAVLLRTLARRDPRSDLPRRGLAVDVGSGWGPLALTMALLAPAVRVAAVDTNQAARELTALNAERLGLDNIAVMTPAEARSLTRIDALWSNPPIRIGKDALHDLLGNWLERLAPDGHADLVVQRNLGADSLQTWLVALGYPTERLASAKGYRVLRAAPRAG